MTSQNQGEITLQNDLIRALGESISDEKVKLSLQDIVKESGADGFFLFLGAATREGFPTLSKKHSRIIRKHFYLQEDEKPTRREWLEVAGSFMGGTYLLGNGLGGLKTDEKMEFSSTRLINLIHDPRYEHGLIAALGATMLTYTYPKIKDLSDRQMESQYFDENRAYNRLVECLHDMNKFLTKDLFKQMAEVAQNRRPTR
jgi:hypothetical protein